MRPIRIGNPCPERDKWEAISRDVIFSRKVVWKQLDALRMQQPVLKLRNRW